MDLQVGFYPFRGPEASFTLFSSLPYGPRGVALAWSRSVDRLAQFRYDGRTGSNPPRTKAGFTVLQTLDGDNCRNHGSAAPKIASEVVKSLRIQSVNRVFGLKLTHK